MDVPLVGALVLVEIRRLNSQLPPPRGVSKAKSVDDAAIGSSAGTPEVFDVTVNGTAVDPFVFAILTNFVAVFAAPSTIDHAVAFGFDHVNSVVNVAMFSDRFAFGFWILFQRGLPPLVEGRIGATDVNVAVMFCAAPVIVMRV